MRPRNCFAPKYVTGDMHVNQNKSCCVGQIDGIHSNCTVSRDNAKSFIHPCVKHERQKKKKLQSSTKLLKIRLSCQQFALVLCSSAGGVMRCRAAVRPSWGAFYLSVCPRFDRAGERAAPRPPTWLRCNFQLELDLWPPSNHGITVCVLPSDVSDGQRVLVAVGGDHVSAARDDVLGVALPLHFSVGLLGLGFKDHGGALHRLLALWLLGKGWN